MYDHVIYESNVEKDFAQSLDNDPEVQLFFKLPRSFKIATPIGSYTPDWAVFLESDGVQKFYFVLETKGSTSEYDLRLKEQMKIKCGKAHFAALETEVTDWWKYKKGLPGGTITQKPTSTLSMQRASLSDLETNPNPAIGAEAIMA